MMSSNSRPAVWLVTTLCFLCACSSETETAGQSGSGGGGSEPSLAPEAFLSTSQYDCTATGPFAPPERPHAQDCFADPSCTSRLITAHRIATPFAPENSLSALRAAILLGVDIIETDLRLTADGEVVFIHDGEVDRTLEGTGEVSSMTLSEIRAMPMQVPSGIPQGDYSCDRTPTLDEIFGLSAGRIVIDLDVKNTQAGIITAQYMADKGLNGDAFLLCSIGQCDEIRAAVPDAPIMSRPKEPDEVAGELLYDPPPIMVHVDATEAFLTPEIIDSIHSIDAKIFANGMLRADIEAIVAKRLEGYGEMFDEGLDVLQVEYPHLALTGLGRLEPGSL